MVDSEELKVFKIDHNPLEWPVSFKPCILSLLSLRSNFPLPACLLPAQASHYAYFQYVRGRGEGLDRCHASLSERASERPTSTSRFV
jgi:hypothetical protein